MSWQNDTFYPLLLSLIIDRFWRFKHYIISTVDVNYGNTFIFTSWTIITQWSVNSENIVSVWRVNQSIAILSFHVIQLIWVMNWHLEWWWHLEPWWAVTSWSELTKLFTLNGLDTWSWLGRDIFQFSYVPYVPHKVIENGDFCFVSGISCWLLGNDNKNSCWPLFGPGPLPILLGWYIIPDVHWHQTEKLNKDL